LAGGSGSVHISDRSTKKERLNPTAITTRKDAFATFYEEAVSVYHWGEASSETLNQTSPLFVTEALARHTLANVYHPVINSKI